MNFILYNNFLCTIISDIFTYKITGTWIVEIVVFRLSIFNKCKYVKHCLDFRTNTGILLHLYTQVCSCIWS